MTNPPDRRAVTGPVQVEEVIGDTGWVDSATGEDYRLALLSEAETRGCEMRQFPDFTSAEGSEQGISLGDMRARMMAKIEELTLHQIAHENKLSALESENASLRERLGTLETSR